MSQTSIRSIVVTCLLGGQRSRGVLGGLELDLLGRLFLVVANQIGHSFKGAPGEWPNLWEPAHVGVHDGDCVRA
jgi:hypothetical protein